MLPCSLNSGLIKRYNEEINQNNHDNMIITSIAFDSILKSKTISIKVKIIEM
jgi:hypothetical protein